MRLMKAWALGVALVLTASAAFAQGGGRRFGGGGFGGPVGLLSIPEVQTELKLDQAQKDLLMQLGQEMRERAQAMFQGMQNVPRDERMKRFQAFQQEQMKKVGEILDAKQMARLKQLSLQQQGTRGLGQPEVADQLKLTADQRQKIQTALTDEGTAMRQAFEGFQGGGNNVTDEQRQQAFQKMRDLRTATDAKLNAVLTDGQKKQFQSMQGAAFKFPERRRGGRGGNNNN
jgi:hypothetical protein